MNFVDGGLTDIEQIAYQVNDAWAVLDTAEALLAAEQLGENSSSHYEEAVAYLDLVAVALGEVARHGTEVDMFVQANAPDAMEISFAELLAIASDWSVEIDSVVRQNGGPTRIAFGQWEARVAIRAAIEQGMLSEAS